MIYKVRPQLYSFIAGRTFIKSPFRIFQRLLSTFVFQFKKNQQLWLVI